MTCVHMNCVLNTGVLNYCRESVVYYTMYDKYRHSACIVSLYNDCDCIICIQIINIGDTCANLM